jgi:hypothetical protein
MTQHDNDANQCIVHILAEALLDVLDKSHGRIVHYNNRYFVVKKDNDSLTIKESPLVENSLHLVISDKFIKNYQKKL